MVFTNWDSPVIFRIDGNCIIINSLKPSREKQLKRRRIFQCKEDAPLGYSDTLEVGIVGIG